jgi:tryptophan halogenase
MFFQNIIIVGGGSAGWMAAATLIKEFPKKNISLIESPSISTVGVGESTIDGVRLWSNWLGIDDKQFLKFTDGSYKLSIKFTDFYKKGESFHYPFGGTYTENNRAGLNDWWFKKFFYPKTLNSDYAECNFPQMALVNQNKCFYNEDSDIPFNFKRDTAFHFDAAKFALWLKDHYCIPKGVKHIKEEITNIEEDSNGIKSLNNKYKADLYIDCTGFSSLLLGKTLKEPFESYSNLLPNNSAWATRIPYMDKEKELVGYTNCTAIENGWVWNIPLWSRIGTGYVYSDKFISDEDALIQFKKYLKKDDLEFKKIKMRVGIHNRVWVKNVIAIGLSAGFIEPLESNGLFSVHEFLMIMLRHMKREKISQWDKDNFNYQSKLLFRNFAEFVAIHYALSHRDDTEYWKSHLNKNWEENLISLKPTHFNGLFTAATRRAHEYHFPSNGGLHCIAAGMNWSPTDLTTAMYINNIQNIEEFKESWMPYIKQLNKRKKIWNEIVKNKQSLFKFLKDNIYDERRNKKN